MSAHQRLGMRSTLWRHAMCRSPEFQPHREQILNLCQPPELNYPELGISDGQYVHLRLILYLAENLPGNIVYDT